MVQTKRVNRLNQKPLETGKKKKKKIDSWIDLIILLLLRFF